MKQKRIVILPTPADPMLLHFWLSHFEKIWCDEVDQLYILAGTVASGDVLKWIVDRVQSSPQSQKIYLRIVNEIVDHGDAINMALDDIEDAQVVLLEDDYFITKQNVLSVHFDHLDHYDVVGSKRGSCSTDILDAAQRKYGLSYKGFGDQGCNLWPSFLFTTTDVLKSTDRHFSAKGYAPGDTVPGLGTFERQLYGDTFVHTSLQLLKQGRSIHYVQQYHCNTDDAPDFTSKKNIFDPASDRFHIGSLSSLYLGMLRYSDDRVLGREKSSPPSPPLAEHVPVGTRDIIREYERRFTWAYLFTRFYRSSPPKHAIPIFSEYENAIHKAILELKLDFTYIKNMYKIYKMLLWPR